MDFSYQLPYFNIQTEKAHSSYELPSNATQINSLRLIQKLTKQIPDITAISFRLLVFSWNASCITCRRYSFYYNEIDL